MASAKDLEHLFEGIEALFNADEAEDREDAIITICESWSILRGPNGDYELRAVSEDESMIGFLNASDHLVRALDNPEHNPVELGFAMAAWRMEYGRIKGERSIPEVYRGPDIEPQQPIH